MASIRPDNLRCASLFGIMCNEPAALQALGIKAAAQTRHALEDARQELAGRGEHPLFLLLLECY